VTYTAACESSSYTWSFADGTTADGRTVTHAWAAGRFGGTLATDFETTPLPQATAVALSLAAPSAADWHAPVTLSGTVAPLGTVRLYRGDSFVTSARPAANGRFWLTVKLLGPGPYTIRSAGVTSKPLTVRVRPVIETQLVGTPTVGRPLTLVAHLRPAAAGTLRAQIGNATHEGRSLRLRLDTKRPQAIRIAVGSVPADGWATARRTLAVQVVYPDLAVGSTGESVHELERRLAELHYALLRVDATYGEDTLDAVTAFQKVEGLSRTGRVDAAVWAQLARATVPKPSSDGTYVEVDKARQVLFVVRDGTVALVVPVSTAGIPGTFTPVGRFSVYRKVAGFDPSPLGVLYAPSYFVGGYAIHGSPSVPPYPASHGCVRVPMWVADRLYAAIPYGEPVYVH
jgi:peptidoglycan hydrolase-like protein with peptidoglycan-binding domain